MDGLPWTVKNRTELKAGFGKIIFCSLKLAKSLIGFCRLRPTTFET